MPRRAGLLRVLPVQWDEDNASFFSETIKYHYLGGNFLDFLLQKNWRFEIDNI